MMVLILSKENKYIDRENDPQIFLMLKYYKQEIRMNYLLIPLNNSKHESVMSMVEAYECDYNY